MVVVDYRDFDHPYGFHVRYYDDKLQYTSHSIIPYKTSSPNHLIYKVMRSPDKVNIWLGNDSVVTQLDVKGYRNYQHFPLDYSLPKVICATLSQKGNLVVVDADSIQPGLF